MVCTTFSPDFRSFGELTYRATRNSNAPTDPSKVEYASIGGRRWNERARRAQSRTRGESSRLRARLAPEPRNRSKPAFCQTGATEPFPEQIPSDPLSKTYGLHNVFARFQKFRRINMSRHPKLKRTYVLTYLLTSLLPYLRTYLREVG